MSNSSFPPLLSHALDRGPAAALVDRCDRAARRSDNEENWFHALRRAASTGRSHREMGLWLALCDELRGRNPESPHVHSLLMTLARGQVPRATQAPESGATLPSADLRDYLRSRELYLELIDRLEHHRSEIRGVLPLTFMTSLNGVPPAVPTGEPAEDIAGPAIALLSEATVLPVGALPPHWNEIDLTQSLREFEQRIREERIRLEEMRFRAMAMEIESLGLTPVTPERARRTLHSAIDKFNHGDLDQALFELEVAENEIRRAFGEPTHRRAVLMGAQSRVDHNRLEDLTSRAGSHPRLRRFLRHFPEWSVQPLMDRLAMEPDRRERRRLLDLLIVHGWDTRRTASSLLLEEATAERSIFPWYVTRNLLFLLRRLVERDADASEVELLSVLDFADFTRPAQVVTEAVGYLSRVPDERSEGRLIKMLDQLGRARTDDARIERAVVEHLLRMPSGRARARAVQFLAERGASDGYHLRLLESLTSEDLGSFPEVVSALEGVLERHRSRGWRRWLRTPRRNAALERTLRQVLATAVSV